MLISPGERVDGQRDSYNYVTTLSKRRIHAAITGEPGRIWPRQSVRFARCFLSPCLEPTLRAEYLQWTLNTMGSVITSRFILTKSLTAMLKQATAHKKRMHSSRMRKVRSLPYRGYSPGGSLSRETPLWTESQTGVKTLLSRNFACGQLKQFRKVRRKSALWTDIPRRKNKFSLICSPNTFLPINIKHQRLQPALNSLPIISLNNWATSI